MSTSPARACRDKGRPVAKSTWSGMGQNAPDPSEVAACHAMHPEGPPRPPRRTGSRQSVPLYRPRDLASGFRTPDDGIVRGTEPAKRAARP